MNTIGEALVPALRALYSRHGYTQYKMSRFEEYDLYVRNKDFLISDSVITFTDTNGKLMALKPDVTLSIIRNGRDVPGCVQKVYYNENVYRVSERHGGFREILQTGLECIGDIDDYCLYEVLMLAAASLKAITDDCVLDISHLGLLSAVVDTLTPQPELQRAIMKCVGEKNPHELRRLCREGGADAEDAELLCRLVATYGPPAQVMPRLKALLAGRDNGALAQLEALLAAFEGSGLEELLRLDFSVVSDMKYYNGIVFKGFVNGVPDSVLSGGQYDRLMQRLHRRSGAIGFALYLDLLERLGDTADRYDVDTVLLYDDTASPQAVSRAVAELTAAGQTVSAQRAMPPRMTCRRQVRLTESGVIDLENHA